MNGPLEGIRVLDWTRGQQGPFGAAMLADLGADVIKIEDPIEGDGGRQYQLHGINRQPGGRNFYFEANNRNKRAITLDLKKEEAKQILYRLVEKSDVFVQNNRKGVAGRLGVDYQTLSQYNPRLIYASATAFGPEGPDSKKPGLDIIGTARSGIMFAIGDLGEPPIYPQGMLADQMGGIMLAWGVLAALVARERLGIGQEVHASLTGSMIVLQGLNVMAYLIQGVEYHRRSRENARQPLFNHYECADGKWLVLAEGDQERWHDICQALGIQDLENAPRFDSVERRFANNRELISILDKVFATKARSEWLERLGQYKDLRYSYVNTIPELEGDPQVLINKYIVDFDHPVWGKIKEIGFPVTFGKTPASLRRGAPEHGQHTEEVLMEILGYTSEDIITLKERAVI